MKNGLRDLLTLTQEELSANNISLLREKLPAILENVVNKDPYSVTDDEIKQAASELTTVINMATNITFNVVITRDLVMPSASFHGLESIIAVQTDKLQKVSDNACAEGKGLDVIRELFITIDSKDGRATGLLSKVPCTLTLSLAFFKAGGFTAEEAAAVVAHEVGHPLDFFQRVFYGFRNLSLADTLTRGIRASNSADNVDRLLDTAEKIFDVKFSNREDLASLGKDETIQLILLSNLGWFKQAVGQNKMYISEYAADEFATRVMGAKVNSSALAKVAKLMGQDVNTSALAWYAVKYARVLVAIAVGLFSPIVGLAGLGLIVGLSVINYTPEPITHPNYVQRLKNMRAASISQYRHPNTPAADKVEIEKTIKQIDEWLAEYGYAKVDIFGEICDLFNPKRKAVYRARELDSKLTMLSHSKLWIQAEQLRNLK